MYVILLSKVIVCDLRKYVVAVAVGPDGQNQPHIQFYPKKTIIRIRVYAMVCLERVCYLFCLPRTPTSWDPHALATIHRR